MEGFYFEHANSHEVRTLHLYAIKHDLKIKWHKYHYQSEFDFNYIPYGDIDWFLKLTGWSISPDYYPEFLQQYLGRKIWREEKWPLRKVFIKPSDKYKRFTGKVTDGSYKGKKKGPYWCSEIVNFKNEWRYYIANGKVLDAKWYFGVNEDKEAPELNIEWPEDYCGAVDFGEVEDKILLVEANDPFSVGWYGSTSENENYGKWVIEGWKWLTKKYLKQ